MRITLLAKALALAVAAMIAVPTMSVEAAKPSKSRPKTTNVRSHKRMDQFRQRVDQGKSNNNSSKSSSKKSATRTNSYSTSSYSTSAPSSTTTTTTTDNTNRKIFLQNQIADWKLKLEKAEKSYRDCVASGEDTPEKQRVVESKKKTVDECLEMIRKYEAELNSLK